jgi:hypothetical protein
MQQLNIKKNPNHHISFFKKRSYNHIENNKGGNWKSSLSVVIGEGTVEAINSFQDYTASYKASLYEEADFGRASFNEVSKEDFKKPYLFWIFLKQTIWTVLKIAALFILIRLLIGQVKGMFQDLRMSSYA